MKSTGQSDGPPNGVVAMSQLKTEQKKDRRREFRAKAAAHATEEQTLSAQVSKSVLDYFRASQNIRKSKWIGCFQALPGEPNLESIFAELRAEGYKLAFPTVHGDDLRFFEINSNQDWQQGPWGLREPSPERAKKVELQTLDILLIPGLAFDKVGVRLGRGKGFYDRTLQNFEGTKIGITYAYALAPELPCEAHDVRMDLIITDEGVHLARERV